MKAIVFTTVVAAAALAFTLCYARPQSYQVNIQFIPALVTGQCMIGQFWSPQNMTCTACFCLTGRISRCVPQPGCSIAPNATSTAGTTVSPFPVDNSTTTATTGSSSSTTTTARVKVRRDAKVGAQFEDDEYKY